MQSWNEAVLVGIATDSKEMSPIQVCLLGLLREAIVYWCTHATKIALNKKKEDRKTFIVEAQWLKKENQK